MVFNDPKWDWRTFDVDRDLAKAEESLKGLLTAIEPKSVGAFFARGGKLLTYHGFSDQDISPTASVNFYKSIVNAVGGAVAESSLRLFMVPGMGHCGGGTGVNTFDMVTPLDLWVTAGKAPAEVPASRVRNGVSDRTRPLCAYPQIAIYKGSGSLDDAANFSCGVRLQR